MSRFSRWASSWVAFWARTETGESLALVRILVPLVMLYDLCEAAARGLVVPLWAPIEEGGIGPASYAEPLCVFYEWFGASASGAWTLFALACASALTLGLGWFTRTSALVLLFSYAQLGQLSPDADRGIDTLLRNVLLVLAVSGAGATLSVDARRATGSFVRDRLVLAFPRYLIIAQLVLLYFFAGILKQSANWSYEGGYAALFLILHKPHFATVLFPHTWLVRCYPLMQAGTFATVVWERTALLLPALLYVRATAERPGRLRHLVNRLHLLEIWVATGVFFHLALAALLALGMFPWGCLALYPALAAPATWRRWYVALVARLGWNAQDDSVPPVHRTAPADAGLAD